VAACQQVPTVNPAASPLALQGKTVAQTSCSRCHAIEIGRSSFSEAPPFPVIANQEGLTAETLSVWLKGAHNYPREMDFYLQEAEVDALVAYMLTLQDPNFRRAPD
jgi:mono/diheme cytochrome c family protein